MNKFYFPGLNGLRFIAVFIVILDHLELMKSYFNLKTLWSNEFSSHVGKFGVTIFFVLSGFLISYLLFLEKKQFHSISIKDFYVRRALRIWPLYFILILLGFFVLPNLDFFSIPVNEPVSVNFSQKFSLYLFFAANVGFVFYQVVPFAGVLWSVAVEEQFYLFWPHLIKHSKRILFVLFISLIVYMLLKISFINNYYSADKVLMNKLVKLIERTRFSSMIIGGIGAWVLFYNKKKILAFVYRPTVQIISLFALLILFFVYNTHNIPYFNLIKNEFISLLVAVLILNISSNTKTLINLEFKVLDFLGKISYGMYVYHSIIAVICVKFFIYVLPGRDDIGLFWSLCLIISVLVFTVAVSYLSYYYFEFKILKFKNRFSHVISGDLAKEK
ncbi:MAG: acyltransferase [Bacteroidia bacterium]|nr:acyltransferase [Bacteroidia bacterium]